MSQKVLTRCMTGIYLRSSYDRFMHGIYQVYTMYILLSIRIYPVYTWYMTFYWHIPRIYQVYDRYIPGGWCCGGGHGPMPPEPPAITSPGLVITVILFDSPPLHILLLFWWTCTALLDTKNAGKPCFSHEQHTKRSIWVSTDDPYGVKAGILRRG